NAGILNRDSIHSISCFGWWRADSGLSGETPWPDLHSLAARWLASRLRPGGVNSMPRFLAWCAARGRTVWHFGAAEARGFCPNHQDLFKLKTLTEYAPSAHGIVARHNQLSSR